VPTSRQICTSIALADVALFLIAVTFNDHSSTSVDGIIWWLALAVFVLLIAVGLFVLLRFLVTRRKRPKRATRVL
jgi:ABC-type nickel/cobalt efflux system permease component RcnA